LISRFLEPEFPGREALRDQLGLVQARSIDENGSLDLRSGSQTVAVVKKRIPTEGEALDSDGTVIHYLLHVVDGVMKELEIYKDDSSVVLRRPNPSEVVVNILEA